MYGSQTIGFGPYIVLLDDHSSESIFEFNFPKNHRQLGGPEENLK